jgi:hypothetical protein
VKSRFLKICLQIQTCTATPGIAAELNLAADVEFIRTNRFDLTPFYKPVAMRAMIAATRLGLYKLIHSLKAPTFNPLT